jgi:hypothetical protein
LARWSSNEPNSYARVFGYDEEGRLVKIERDYGSGGVQLAYEYGYNSDGARVWKRDRRDMQNEQEYRYVCGIGCGGVPMRVYNRPMNGGSWASVEDYLLCSRVNIYTNQYGTFLDISIGTNNLLCENGGQQRSQLVVRDTHGSTVELYLLNFPPPHYLLDNGFDDYAPQALMWKLVIGGAVVIFAVSVHCLLTMHRTREEVWKWENEEIRYDHGGGADKLAHCVAACLVGLRAGRVCALLAARATERADNYPWGQFTGDPADEKANFDGVDCSDEIKGCPSLIHACLKPPWVTGNEWLDCQSCCRQKGYRGVIKWR